MGVGCPHCRDLTTGPLTHGVRTLLLSAAIAQKQQRKHNGLRRGV